MAYQYKAAEAAILAKCDLLNGQAIGEAVKHLMAGTLSQEAFTAWTHAREAASAAARATEFEFSEWGCAFPMKGKRFGKLDLSPAQVDMLATVTDGKVVPTAQFAAYVNFVHSHRAEIDHEVSIGRAAYDAKKAQEKLSKLSPADRAALVAEAAKQAA